MYCRCSKIRDANIVPVSYRTDGKQDRRFLNSCRGFFSKVTTDCHCVEVRSFYRIEGAKINNTRKRYCQHPHSTSCRRRRRRRRICRYNRHFKTYMLTGVERPAILSALSVAVRCNSVHERSLDHRYMLFGLCWLQFFISHIGCATSHRCSVSFCSKTEAFCFN
jgi:hypothetical protein